MNPLLELVNNQGYITSENMGELVKDFPFMTVVIKWGAKPRTQVFMKDVEKEIEAAEQAGDYCREVFISCEKMDTLRNVLGIV